MYHDGVGSPSLYHLTQENRTGTKNSCTFTYQVDPASVSKRANDVNAKLVSSNTFSVARSRSYNVPLGTEYRRATLTAAQRKATTGLRRGEATRKDNLQAYTRVLTY